MLWDFKAWSDRVHLDTNVVPPFTRCDTRPGQIECLLFANVSRPPLEYVTTFCQIECLLFANVSRSPLSDRVIRCEADCTEISAIKRFHTLQPHSKRNLLITKGIKRSFFIVKGAFQFQIGFFKGSHEFFF